ncbi:MAG TPA: FKBP-type peptidyl-prolyl cis-trans isomerase [Longimicrobiales bacterium]|nr:FKBP-type peptidyl-prolyl cis-trans isomerase [Longimicrobiales bacterium]
MKKFWMMAAMSGLIAMTACGDDLTTVADVPTLQITDVVVGTGATAVAGKQATVHYTGWVYDANTADHHGKKFDSSVDRGTPYQFTPGVSQVIQGWHQGVPGMKVGGKRTLIIPSSLAYGASGSGSIPGGSAIVFDIELLGVQ